MENNQENFNNEIVDLLGKTLSDTEDADNQIAFVKEEFKSNFNDPDALSEIKSWEDKKLKTIDDFASTLTKAPEQFWVALNFVKQKIFNIPFIENKELQNEAVKLSEKLESFPSRFEKGDDAEKTEVGKMFFQTYAEIVALTRKTQALDNSQPLNA